MKKCILVVLALILLVHPYISAQGYKGQGKFMGSVFDEKGNPLEGVKVKLFSEKGQSGFETVTDANGRWKAFYVRGGPWKIDFERAGYMPKRINIQILESGQNPAIETKLQKIEGLIITDELKAAIDQGNKLFEEKKYEEAIGVYEGLIASNPDAYVINKNIGNCYFELQKYDKAEESYRKVLDKEPDNSEIMLLIGNCYANRGENEKAMEWYHKIEFEKITDRMVLFNIGSSFYSQSKYEEALKYYKKAVEIQKDFTDAIYQLGLTYLAMGNNQDAIANFENYLKYDADSQKANQVKGFLDFLKKK
jgi:tetratricopeptide (TPR) repeat protein